MKTRLSSALIGFFFIIGCGNVGSSKPGGAGGAGGSGSGGAGGSAGGVGSGYTMAAELTIGPFDLPSGMEVTKCITLRIPTTASIDVTRIESTLAAGSHHLILYKSTDTAEAPTPVDCRPFVGIITGTIPLYIAESPEARLDLPPGIAYAIPAGQMYRLEAHYINTTTAPITGRGSVRLFTYAQPGQVTDHANIAFWGNAAISLPPDGQQHSVGPTWHAINDGRTVFGMTTHTHRLGVDAKIEYASSLTDPGRLLLDNPNWDNPPLLLVDPPMKIPAGMGFRFTCTYVNNTGATVTFGESATDEMCFIWTYYYPDAGFQICVDGLGGFGNRGCPQ